METPVRVRVELLSVGSTVQLGLLVGMRSWKARRFPTLVALIRHPSAGAILFDTGYGSRMRNGNGLALAVYRTLTPVRLRPEELVDRQLIARGVDPRRLAFIFISHAHPDHIGGLGDLPPRPVVWSRETHDAFTSGTGFSRFRESIFPTLLPPHVWTQNSLIEDRPIVRLGDTLPGLPLGYDLMGDGSLIAVPLPGHARGQHGLLCRVEGDRLLFLVADAAWVSVNITEKANQSAFLDMLIHDTTAYRATLGGLRRLHRARPDIAVVPTHCAASIAAWQQAVQ